MAQRRLDAIAAAPQGRALLGDVLDVLLDVWRPSTTASETRRCPTTRACPGSGRVDRGIRSRRPTPRGVDELVGALANDCCALDDVKN